MLAQQIVAIAAEDEIEVAELHRLVRGAYPFASLSREQLENVLDMLAGRYPSDEFAELRPRIVWDRTAGVIRGRQGARRLAVTNAGTIPDRGLFGVFLLEGGGRVGELDEEMVYEARQGQTFLLGASTWRIEEITRDRVLVSPAPGVPGLIPFWKGEGVGRPFELGEKIGAASRSLVALSDAKAVSTLRSEYHLDERAARNLLVFLREQEAATGAVPSDRTIVVERFRDEIGDWRVCILTPFGGRVHAPWAMALASRLRDGLGIEVQSIWSDDGIALHLPDADAPPPVADLLIGPDEIEELVVQEVGQTALFGSRFRENASRALLIPRRRPGQRTPLWQQRLKAQSLLQVARKYGSFPIVLETYRECLQDVFDLPALRRILHGLQTRELDLVEVETASASPFAASLLFDYVATYMYEDDTPPAERRAQALSLDRDLLRELLGQEELRELLDRDAIEEVERSLEPTPRNADELHDLLRMRGHRFAGAYDEGFAETLLARAARDPLPARRTGRDRGRGGRRAVPRRGRRDAAGRPTRRVPGGRLRVAAAARAPLCEGAGPVHDRRDRRVLRLGSSRACCTSWSGRMLSSAVSCARAAPSGSGAIRRCCAGCAERRSPHCAGRSSRPSRPRSAASCPPGTGSAAVRACARHSCRCRGCRCRCRSGRPRCCRGACPATSPLRWTHFAQRASSSWVGAGLDRVAVYFREDAPLLGRPAGAPPPEGEAADAIRRTLAASAEFWYPLVEAAGLEPELALPALWELVWAGEVTNDAWTPLRAGRRYATPSSRVLQGRRRFSRTRTTQITSTQGRWSLTDRLFPGLPDRRALAELLLERQGIVTRDGVRGEGIAGGYGAVYGELKDLETIGVCRRGYFVEGLGGAQFALPGAVERLRELRADEDPEPLVLAAADPAQPYGAALPWPKRAGARAARVAGAQVVLLGGEAALFVERGGRTLVPLRDPDDEWLRPAIEALVAHVRAGGAKRLAVERFDGRPVVETEVMQLLVEAGFLAGPRRAVLRP